jgi:hypothetical protein
MLPKANYTIEDCERGLLIFDWPARFSSALDTARAIALEQGITDADVSDEIMHVRAGR